VFIQTLGIGIGSTGSPSQCMALCMFCEKHFQDSIRDYCSFFVLLRFFDDVRAWLFLNKRNPQQEALGKALLELYAKSCYHESMVLIPEQQHEKCIKFLETVITLEGKHKFTCHFYSKNFDHILNHGKPKIWSGQDAYSWGNDKRRQKNTLLGRLVLIDRVSTSNFEIIKGYTHLLIHYMFLGFKQKAFLGALKMMEIKTSKIVYKCLAIHTNVTFYIFSNHEYLKEFSLLF
jgi:hypothetical protein